MKNCIFILTGIFLLYACELPVCRLTEVERMIQDRPDSAWVILQDWKSSSLKSRRGKAYYALLYSMALDKCYIDVENDSLTRMALDYYKNSRDRDHKMKAYYYDGLVQKNLGNTIGALQDLEKARSLAKQNKDYHYIGLSARNLGMLHNEEWDYDESTRCIEESLDAFRMAGEDNYALYSLLGLARCCQNTGRYQESDSLHHVVLRDSNLNASLERNAFMSLAGLKMNQTEPEPKEVLNAMAAYQRAGGRMYTDPAIIKARAFVYTGQMDSAKYYLDIARAAAVTAVDSASCYFGSYEYLAARKEFESADLDLRKCFDIEDSLTVLRLKRSVMHAQNDSYRRESEYQKDLAEKRLVILFLVGCLVILAGFLASGYYRRKMREFDQEVDRFDAVEGELKEQIMLLKENDERQKAGLISMIVGRISVITMLGREYSALQEAPSRESSYDHFDRMKTVVNDCKQEINALRGDTTFLIGLEKAVNESHEQVIARLRLLFGDKMTEQDYRIITLLVAGTPIKGISLVTGIEPGTLSTRKTRYKERILKTGARDAAFFIDKIYREPLKAPEVFSK